MTAEALAGILRENYGLDGLSLSFLREGGSRTYLAEGADRYLVKVIGPAFKATAGRSAAILCYLEKNGFPVPRTVLTRSGEALLETSLDEEDQLIVVQEYIDGEEPDLTVRAAEVGALTARLHDLLEAWPEPTVSRGRQFFIGRYLDFLREKQYPRLSAYEELGDRLWQQVKDQPSGICHGDLHRGNLLESKDGRICFLDFDTVCRAPLMFDVMVMCDMTDYFRLKQKDIEITKTVYAQFLSGYSRYRELSEAEKRSFKTWTAIRHFQLQATILEIYGIDCIDEAFIDRQLNWLERWITEERMPSFSRFY